MEVVTEECRTEVKRRWYHNVRPHPEYLRTLPGILKILEIIFCTIIFICIALEWFRGEQFVYFSVASALINVVFNFAVHFVNIHHFFFFWFFLEFVEYCIYDVLFAISAIIAAVSAARQPAVEATAFFLFASVAVLLMDTYYMYRTWQEHKAEQVATQRVTNVTTVTTMRAAKY